MSKDALITRPCGAVHPAAGEVCLMTVYTEPAPCCGEPRVYQHEGPHEVVRDGHVIRRWEETLVVKDAPFDGYAPPQDTK